MLHITWNTNVIPGKYLEVVDQIGAMQVDVGKAVKRSALAQSHH